MLRHRRLEHRFVTHVPDRLEPGVLYISVEYCTVSHLCCCGCGEEIVTPLSPTDWKLTYNGESVTLSPSIGNWSLNCRSHYFIERSRIAEALPWSDEEIAEGQRRNREAKRRYYGTSENSDGDSGKPKSLARSNDSNVGIWTRMMRLLRRP
ncbi:MAG: DUF6527 family protein [Phycisphaerae bacterium]|nr:hypothetical protein [Phycisphaerales bacterium]